MAALVTGTIFGVWIGFNPMGLSASAYIEQQQNAIAHLNVLMPLLGLITIILTVISAFLHKTHRNAFIMLLLAAVFLIISGLITRFGNQPINSLVMTWNSTIPPANWEELRDEWWSFHILRTLSSLVALCLIVWTTIRKD
jgi:uncharacterized membrane protein